MWTSLLRFALFTRMCTGVFALPQIDHQIRHPDISKPQALHRRIQQSGVRRKAVNTGSSSDKDKTHSAWEQTADQNKIDACPHIQSNNGELKLRMLDFPDVTWACCPCGRGEKLVGPCRRGEPNSTQCVPCKSNSYMNKDAHEERECFLPDVHCDNKAEVYIPHTPTSAPECHCRADKSLYRASNGSCLIHSECPPGEGVKALGSRDADTKCEPCKGSYESQIWSRTERCKLKNSVWNHPNNNHLLPQQKTGTTTTAQETIAKTTQDQQQKTIPMQQNTTQPTTLSALNTKVYTLIKAPSAMFISAFIVFVIAVICYFGSRRSPATTRCSAMLQCIRKFCRRCVPPFHNFETAVTTAELSSENEAGVNEALVDSILLKTINGAARFESAPDVERGNRNTEEPDVTEELTLLGVNETKSQPQTSSRTSATYCKRMAKKEKKKPMPSSSSRDDESVCEPSTSTSFPASPYQPSLHGRSDQHSSFHQGSSLPCSLEGALAKLPDQHLLFETILIHPQYHQPAPIKPCIRNKRREIMNNVKVELSSRVRSHVSHRLFRKKTTFDDHQIETFLDDISGKSSEHQFNAVFKKLGEQLPWKDFNPQTLHDFFMDPDPLCTDHILADFLKDKFPEAFLN